MSQTHQPLLTPPSHSHLHPQPQPHLRVARLIPFETGDRYFDSFFFVQRQQPPPSNLSPQFVAPVRTEYRLSVTPVLFSDGVALQVDLALPRGTRATTRFAPVAPVSPSPSIKLISPAPPPSVLLSSASHLWFWSLALASRCSTLSAPILPFLCSSFCLLRFLSLPSFFRWVPSLSLFQPGLPPVPHLPDSSIVPSPSFSFCCPIHVPSSSHASATSAPPSSSHRPLPSRHNSPSSTSTSVPPGFTTLQSPTTRPARPQLDSSSQARHGRTTSSSWPCGCSAREVPRRTRG